jgi:hypothetical protein
MAGTKVLMGLFAKLNRQASRPNVKGTWMEDKLVEAAGLVNEVILELEDP